MSKFRVQASNFAERVRESFARQQLMATIGASLKLVQQGVVEIELPFRPDLTQQHGFLHAGTVATVLDSRGIAVRAGHHCAKPAHARFGVQSSTRMSSYLYTTPAEIDALVEGLEYTRSYFKLG